MATKRKRDAHAIEGDTSSFKQPQLTKKPKKGFSIGPDHLPDGPNRRKVQKIKRNMIEKAKTRKEYAKMKQKLLEEQQPSRDKDDLAEGQSEQVSIMHPDRIERLQHDVQQSTQDGGSLPESGEKDYNYSDHQGQPRQRHDRQHRTRVPRYAREEAIATKRREEAEARRLAKVEANRQREEKLAERERYRKAMEKAKGAGKNGQRKLGRESGVLLEKVQRMMAG